MKPHLDETIKALAEGWFLGGDLGTKYGMVLKRYVDERTDQPALDAALALGAYAVHSDGNKQQRKALRAVLLAQFVMREQPLSIKDQLVARYKGLSTDDLKAEFRHTFPPFLDEGNRASWAPANFTRPFTLGRLLNPEDWRTTAVPPYRFITHALRAGSRLLADPNMKLQEWLAISCGVQSSDKPTSYSNHGLILYVPENNVITTSPTDQWFDNFAGTSKSTKAPDQSLAQHIGEKTVAIGGLLTPDNVIAEQNTLAAMNHMAGTSVTAHNEVIVCGVPHYPMPYGRTGLLSVLGLYLQIKTDGTFPSKYLKSKGDVDIIRLAVEDAGRRLGVPVLYLPDPELN
jgi:hypothetical protein